MQVFFNSHLETILWRYQFYTGIYDQSILKWLKYKYFQEIFLRNVIYCILVATVVNCLDQLYSEFPYYFSFLVDNLLALNETQQKLCLFNFRFFSEKCQSIISSRNSCFIWQCNVFCFSLFGSARKFFSSTQVIYNFITNLLLLISPFTMCNLIVNRNCNNKYVKTYDKVWCNASNNVKIAFKHLFYSTMGLQLI